MNKNLKTVLKFLIEIIVVAFGVFLGIYYNNINTNNKIKEEKIESINLIIEEIDLNRLLIERNIEYHENIKLEIDSLFPHLSEKELNMNLTQSKFNHNDIKGWTGFSYARLQNTAYETAKISGIIKEFDLEQVQRLSQLYSMQSVYMDFGGLIQNEAIRLNSSMKTWDLIRLIELMTSDLLGTEKQLLSEIEATQVSL